MTRFAQEIRVPLKVLLHTTPSIQIICGAKIEISPIQIRHKKCHLTSYTFWRSSQMSVQTLVFNFRWTRSTHHPHRFHSLKPTNMLTEVLMTKNGKFYWIGTRFQKRKTSYKEMIFCLSSRCIFHMVQGTQHVEPQNLINLGIACSLITIHILISWFFDLKV
jgi:hypothetical protein